MIYYRQVKPSFDKANQTKLIIHIILSYYNSANIIVSYKDVLFLFKFLLCLYYILRIK